MVNLTPSEYRAWEQRRYVGGARRAVDVFDRDDIGWGDVEQHAVAEMMAMPTRVVHTLDSADFADLSEALIRSGPVHQAPVYQPPEALEVPEGDGPLGLRVELWWMRRRLTWQLRGLYEPATGEPTYRRRNRLLSGTALATTFGTGINWAMHIFDNTPPLLALPFMIWGALWLVWLLPMRFWRADR